MSADWRADVRSMADTLNDARAVAVFGLAGISLEDQHRAFALIRKLGAYVSVERPLLPTLTFGSLSQHKLILTAGGEPDVPLPAGAETARDDRLASSEAWRCLRVLRRGRTAYGAEAYAPLHEKITAAGGAALLLCGNRVPDELRTELTAYRAECGLPLGLDLIQISTMPNLLGAYETALEEAGGAHASFAGGEAKADAAFALGGLLRQRAVGAALLIGECVSGAGETLDAGVPLYSLGRETPGARIFAAAARFGPEDGGTALRCDGMPVSVVPARESGLPRLCALLDALTAEVGVC